MSQPPNDQQPDPRDPHDEAPAEPPRYSPPPAQAPRSDAPSQPAQLPPSPQAPRYAPPPQYSPPPQLSQAPNPGSTVPPRYMAPQSAGASSPAAPASPATSPVPSAAPSTPSYAPPSQPGAAPSAPSTQPGSASGQPPFVVPVPIPPPPPGYAPVPPQGYVPPQGPPQYGAPPQYAYQQTQPGYAAGPLPPAGPGSVFDGALHPGELYRPLYGASIGQALARFFKNYANFTGRASRSEFWWVAFVYWLGILVLGIAGGLIGDTRRSSPLYEVSQIAGGLIGFFALLVVLGSIVPWLAISWRRLHDANLAGPLWLISLVPYVGSLVVLVLTVLPPRPEGRRFDQPRR